MMTDMGNTAVIVDFGAQTITNIDRSHKSYTAKKFTDVAKDAPSSDMKFTMSADFKETGEHKTIDGFQATESVMTFSIDMGQRGGGMKMETEMHLWVSPDVPGASEMEAFYKRNMANFPWSAVLPAGNESMRAAMAQMAKKTAELHGVPVIEVMRMKMGAASMTPEQQAQMEKSKAQLEAMQAKGGAQAQMAAQALARMGAITGSGTEITTESSGFSTALVPDSVFAIPAGYEQKK
jgi:hypothetical protein